MALLELQQVSLRGAIVTGPDVVGHINLERVVLVVKQRLWITTAAEGAVRNPIHILSHHTAPLQMQAQATEILMKHARAIWL